jgi:hypothetical protein
MDQARSIRLLQGNLNHCSAAQNLFVQTSLEWLIDVAVMAEPYWVRSDPYWATDSLQTVLVMISSGSSAPPIVLDRGQGFVSVLWENWVVVGTYFSPNRTLAEFKTFIVELTVAVRRAAPRPVIVMGDLNAKSTAWGSPITDARGRVVCGWAAATGLVLLNRGTDLTCVRQQGGSIVDVTFASPAIATRVKDWRVAVEVETLSDHRYIRFEVSPLSTVLVPPNRRRDLSVFPR